MKSNKQESRAVFLRLDVTSSASQQKPFCESTGTVRGGHGGGNKKKEEAVQPVVSHAAPHGVCDNLINALQLLANQQKDGDSPVNVVVQGLLEKSGLQVIGVVDNHEAVRVGEHGVEASGEAEVHDRSSGGADELALRRRRRRIAHLHMDTSNSGRQWMGSTTRERRLTCHLSSHCPMCRGIGMGDHALHIQGVAPSGHMYGIWRQQECQALDF